jgi:hypothetical protein
MDINTYVSLSSVSFTETNFCSDKCLGRFAADATRKVFSLHVGCLLLLTGFKTQKAMKFFVKFSNIIFHEYVFNSSHVHKRTQPHTAVFTGALPRCVSTLKILHQMKITAY